MAVEAGPHHSLFHPQMMLTNNSTIDINNNQINTPLRYTYHHHNNNPISTTTAMYCSGNFADSLNNFPANTTPLKAESGLTCSLPVSRKRPRDSLDFNTLNSFVNTHHHHHQNMIQNHNQIGSYKFLGEDISFQIQQQQLEIDQFVAHQTEKVRLEIEEGRKRNSRRIIAAVEEGISKKLEAKQEEILKITRLNQALEEKVKSLYVENQIWREVAQTNEATANTLRNNLKQVLEQVVKDDFRHNNNACVDEAESCCESNNEELENDECSSSSNNNNRMCKKCGKDESCVLLLPCRHLCLCNGCASSVNICPICKSVNNISVHVNMS